MIEIKTIDGQHIIAANYTAIIDKLRENDHMETVNFRHYMTLVRERHADVLEITRTPDHNITVINIKSQIGFLMSLHKLGYITEIKHGQEH